MDQTVINANKLAARISALSSVDRLRVVDVLIFDKCHASTIAERIKLTLSALSWHLRLMKSLGFTSSRKSMQNIYHSINAERNDEFPPWRPSSFRNSL